MKFAQPDFFYLFVLFPFWMFLWYWQAKKRPFLYFSQIDFPVYRGWRWWIYQTKLWLRLGCLALLIVALATPYITNQQNNKLGIDIILAMDISLSMETQDMDANKSRLDIVKSVVQEFISQRKDDRMGIVIFGRDAARQCPLTYDHHSLEILLQQIQIGDIDGEKTAIGAGLATSCFALESSQRKTKIVILLTDGVNNISKIPVEQATALAQSMGVKVYCIGVGTPSKAFLKEYDVQLDEALLQQIAQQTAGTYFYAKDVDALHRIYQTIDQLEKSRYETHLVVMDSCYDAYVIWAILILIMEWMMALWLSPIPSSQ